MLTLENSSPDSSVACAYYAKFFLTWGWLDQNSKTCLLYTSDVYKRQGLHMAFQKRFRRFAWKGNDEAVVRVRQIHGEKVRLRFQPGDHHHGFAEVHLGFSRCVAQRDEPVSYTHLDVYKRQSSGSPTSRNQPLKKVGPDRT